MRRPFPLLAVALLLAVATLPHAHAAKKKGKGKQGVFGAINGKPFTATNRSSAEDPCMNGIYRPDDNILTFVAVECKGKRRRQGVAMKKNYRVLAISCLRADASGPTLVPPYDVPCPFSGYTEYRTGRFGLPISQSQWTADTTYDFVTNTTGSKLHARIDAFDGTTIRGALYGEFAMPLSGPAATGPVSISGEVGFAFPVRVEY